MGSAGQETAGSVTIAPSRSAGPSTEEVRTCLSGLYLSIAIAAEVIGTSFLKSAAGFTGLAHRSSWSWATLLPSISSRSH